MSRGEELQSGQVIFLFEISLRQESLQMGKIYRTATQTNKQPTQPSFYYEFQYITAEPELHLFSSSVLESVSNQHRVLLWKYSI